MRLTYVIVKTNIMKKLILLLILIFISNLLGAQSFWTQKNDFPGNARTRGICFSLNGYAYYGSGNHTSGQVESSDF